MPRAVQFWYSWRSQLKYFSKQYRVVAIDMRGFGESGKPAPSWFTSQNYAAPLLMEDVRGVIEGLGYKSCVLVAHDWGGAVAWGFAANFPQYVDRVRSRALSCGLLRLSHPPSHVSRHHAVDCDELPTPRLLP